MKKVWSVGGGRPDEKSQRVSKGIEVGEPNPELFSVTLEEEKLFVSKGNKARKSVEHAFDGKSWWLWSEGRHYRLRSKHEVGGSSGATHEGSEIRAPMTGTLRELLVAKGAKVEAGTVVARMEAMKMEYAVLSPRAGRVFRTQCQPGKVVEVGDVLIELEVLEKGETDRG